MSQDPTYNFNPEATVCPPGYVPNDVFYDGFEYGTGQWTIKNQSPFGLTWQPMAGAATTGIYSLYGPDYQGADVGDYDLQTYAQTGNILIPQGNTYLHFDHIFGFEDPNYDGGVLRYSVNGGGWQDANSLLADGLGYTGTVSSAYGNPIGGSQAFVGDSHGYVSSKYTLSAFSGQNLRFQWLSLHVDVFEIG